MKSRTIIEIVERSVRTQVNVRLSDEDLYRLADLTNWLMLQAPEGVNVTRQDAMIFALREAYKRLEKLKQDKGRKR